VVIAAGSVVRGTVPDQCVVAGVPARVVRSYVPGDGWSPSARPAPSGPVSAWTGPGAAGALLSPGGPTPPIPPGVESVEGVAQPVDPPG
jgi:hypothetical protein